MTANVHKIIAAAEAHCGYHEGRNNDNKFGAAVGKNHEPWCAIFVAAVAKEAGATTGHDSHSDYSDSSYCPTALQFYDHAARLYDHPHPADQVIYVHRSSGVAYHTGIVIAVNGDTFTTVEGNTSPDHGVDPDGGGVYRRHHSLADLRRNGIIAKFGRPHVSKEADVHPAAGQHPHPHHDTHGDHDSRTIRITYWDGSGDYDYVYRSDTGSPVKRADSSTGHHHWTPAEAEKILATLAERGRHGHQMHDHEFAFVEKADHTHWPLDHKLVSALDEVGRDLKRKVRVISGHRTLAEQTRLYRLYKAGHGNLAAYPNANAPHIRGIAADCGIITHDGNYTSIANYHGAPNALKKHGLNATVHSEAWHVSRACYGPWAYSGAHPS